MTTAVYDRLALLKAVRIRCAELPYARECFGRCLGVVALGSVLGPMISSQSPAWNERIEQMTLRDWFELLAVDQAYDRFRYGALARNSLALGLLIGDRSTSGAMSVELDALRPTKAEGLYRSMWGRIKGMKNAPKDALADDFGAWLSGMSDKSIAGAKVKISEQSLFDVCQWVRALADAPKDMVVDGTVWSILINRLDAAE